MKNKSMDPPQSHPKMQQNFKKLAENYMNAKITNSPGPSSQRDGFGPTGLSGPALRQGVHDNHNTRMLNTMNVNNNPNQMDNGRKTQSNVKATQLHPLIQELNKPEILMGAYYPQNMNRYLELNGQDMVSQYLDDHIQRDELGQRRTQQHQP